MMFIESVKKISDLIKNQAFELVFIALFFLKQLQLYKKQFFKF